MNSLNDIIKTFTDKISFEKIISAVVVLVIFILLSRVVAKVVERVLIKTKLSEGMKHFAATIVRYLCYFLSLLIFCDVLGVPITSLLAAFSLLGLAVSLSVQSVLSNLMSGVCILMMKPFDIGDYIETDIAGTVKNIGLFYTEILTPDNKKVFIPNEKIMANKLINYNDEGTRRIDFRFNAGYEYDTETVKATLREAIDAVEGVLAIPEPVVGISEYGDSAVIYSVWIWVKSSDYFTVKFKVMDSVAEKYKKNGIQMAYNRLEVDIIK